MVQSLLSTYLHSKLIYTKVFDIQLKCHQKTKPMYLSQKGRQEATLSV